ncbi:MAG: LysM domain-containing protein [Baekduia sp.]
MARPARPSPARWLAVVALLVAGLLVGYVTASTLGGGSDASPAATTKAGTPKAAKQPSRRFYVVRGGDVLSVIAEKFDVPVSTLEELNPEIDARTLRPGTRIRLRR